MERSWGKFIESSALKAILDWLVEEQRYDVHRIERGN